MAKTTIAAKPAARGSQAAGKNTGKPAATATRKARPTRPELRERAAAAAKATAAKKPAGNGIKTRKVSA
jgi:hypothetical protein